MHSEIPHQLIRRWLILGLIMIFFQIIIGGITRLTGSGLSITEWDVIMGSFPPIQENDWLVLFDKYKQFPQYKIMNTEMNLSGFKTIFWWEYIHRLWARLFALVFIIPFIYFIYKKWLNNKLIVHLSLLFILGGAQGLIGWIMVKSGLKDNPWVNPLNLSFHLMMALFVYAYLLQIVSSYKRIKLSSPGVRFILQLNLLIGLLTLQIFYGALMAGHKAALFYPTWPTIGSEWIPSAMNTYTPAWLNLFENKALIHFIHRGLAYILLIAFIAFWFHYRNHIISELRNWLQAVPILVLVQVLLGIITVISSLGHIPALWGVLHQATAILLLTVMLYLRFSTAKKA
ncbi:MAG: COX15/CtaA family protein [Bacteroidota bacterium]